MRDADETLRAVPEGVLHRADGLLSLVVHRYATRIGDDELVSQMREAYLELRRLATSAPVVEATTTYEVQR